MSFWDTLTGQSNAELMALRDIRTALANIAAQDGETDLLDEEVRNGLLHDYIGVPASGGPVAAPAGTTTIDFENGKVTSTGASDPITTDVEDISDLESQTSALRSLVIATDTPGRLRLDDRDWTRVDPGWYSITAQRFQSVDFEADIPAGLVVVASTRSQPFLESSVDIRTSRVGQLAADTYNSYTAVPTYPPYLAGYIGDQKAVAAAMDPIPNDGNEATTVLVNNISGNGNAIDARLQGALTVDAQGNPNWFDLPKESTGITDGASTQFTVTQAVQYLRPQIQNSTDGQNVAASVEVHGEGR